VKDCNLRVTMYMYVTPSNMNIIHGISQ